MHACWEARDALCTKQRPPAPLIAPPLTLGHSFHPLRSARGEPMIGVWPSLGWGLESPVWAGGWIHRSGLGAGITGLGWGLESP
eukprot:361014-Chlamydomonas_euryale.AAC.10